MVRLVRSNMDIQMVIRKRYGECESEELRRRFDLETKSEKIDKTGKTGIRWWRICIKAGFDGVGF